MDRKKRGKICMQSCKARENVRLDPSETGVKRAKYVTLVSPPIRDSDTNSGCHEIATNLVEQVQEK